MQRFNNKMDRAPGNMPGSRFQQQRGGSSNIERMIQQRTNRFNGMDQDVDFDGGMGPGVMTRGRRNSVPNMSRSGGMFDMMPNAAGGGGGFRNNGMAGGGMRNAMMGNARGGPTTTSERMSMRMARRSEKRDSDFSMHKIEPEDKRMVTQESCVRYYFAAKCLCYPNDPFYDETKVKNPCLKDHFVVRKWSEGHLNVILKIEDAFAGDGNAMVQALKQVRDPNDDLAENLHLAVAEEEGDAQQHIDKMTGGLICPEVETVGRNGGSKGTRTMKTKNKTPSGLTMSDTDDHGLLSSMGLNPRTTGARRSSTSTTIDSMSSMTRTSGSRGIFVHPKTKVFPMGTDCGSHGESDESDSVLLTNTTYGTPSATAKTAKKTAKKEESKTKRQRVLKRSDMSAARSGILNDEHIEGLRATAHGATANAKKKDDADMGDDDGTGGIDEEEATKLWNAICNRYSALEKRKYKDAHQGALPVCASSTGHWENKLYAHEDTAVIDTAAYNNIDSIMMAGGKDFTPRMASACSDAPIKVPSGKEAASSSSSSSASKNKGQDELESEILKGAMIISLTNELIALWKNE